MKFGIIKERKNPPDKRVVLSPRAAKDLEEAFTELQILVEPSDVRAFKDDEYQAEGLIMGDMNDADVLLGVKEVPIDALIPNKKYFFFSHTIKKQPYNRELLRAILDKNIEMFDHEVITNTAGVRTVAFGRYAGIVGAYNGIRTWGLKQGIFDLPKAEHLRDQQALIEELQKIDLNGAKIVLTGKGRVASGAKEMLDAMRIKQLSPADFLATANQYNEPVYTQIDVMDYNKRKDGSKGSSQDFYKHPELYESDFKKFSQTGNFLITGHFFGQGSPFLFTREDAKKDTFNLEVVADVSCDIDGPIASTIKPSTIADPIYGYNPKTESEDDFKKDGIIAVMAVDNLPCELPIDASVGFGEQFAKSVIPAFFNQDKDAVLERARMTKNGKLTERFAYLQDYVDGKA